MATATLPIPARRIRVTWRPPEVVEAPPSADPLVRTRRKTLASLRRARLGFWRSLGRSNRLFPRKLIVTREGKWIIGIALLLGAAAVNTGNNLLYLVLSLVISVISVSGLLSELCLRELEVERCYPQELEVGEPTLLRLQLRNDKKRAALHVEAGEVSDAPDDVQVRDGYVLHLQGGETAQAFAAVRALRRGPIATAGLQVSTAFPFGFAKKSRLFEDAAQFVALPPVAHVELAALGAIDPGSQVASRRHGHGDEFAGLRDARPGDPLRDVHWKVSARRGRPVVREWQAEATRVAVVRFVHAAPLADPHPRTLDGACATVAGLCATLLDKGYAVGLQTLDSALPPATGGAANGDTLLQIRRALAWLTPADRPPPADWPLDDETWAQAHRTASARMAQVREGEPLALYPMAAAQHAAVYEVRFASRSDVHVAGRADVIVQLDSTGAIVGVVRQAGAVEGER